MNRNLKILKSLACCLIFLMIFSCFEYGHVNAIVVDNTTQTIMVKLIDSQGKGLSGGNVKYCTSSWYAFGITGESGTVELEIPSKYSYVTFRMEYEGGRQDIKQNIAENPVVVFRTLDAVVNLVDSKGTGLEGGFVKYCNWTWKDFGYTASDGKVHKELLQGTYTFRMEYNQKREDLKQDIRLDNTINFSAAVPAVIIPDDEEQDDVIVVSNVNELMATEQSTKRGNVTVLIKDGTYQMPRGLWLTGSNITYKSFSGNRDNVVLKGSFKISHVFWITNDNVTIQDLTLGEVNNHGIQIHSELDADNANIKNVRFYDIKEQMLKGSGASTQVYSDNCIVEDCLFEFTSGKAFQYYSGGIDVHKGKNWVVRNNEFRNIQTLSGSLTEGAIHFWNSSEGTIIEGNKIFNCDRGIMLGLDNSPHYGGLVINNFIHVSRDVGIYLCQAQRAKVYNNTVFNDSNYPNSIEYRFTTTGTEIINNLTNKAIASRNGGTALVENNIINSQQAWFADFAGEFESNEIVIKVTDLTESDYKVTDVTAKHRFGQTFITWTEPQPLIMRENIKVVDYFSALKSYPKSVRYRVYASESPIISVEGLTPLAEVKNMSCWKSGIIILKTQHPIMS